MKQLYYLGSDQPPPETRGESSTAVITLQGRQGLEQEVVLPAYSFQPRQKGGIWSQLSQSPLCGVLALGHCAARGCQGHGPVVGMAAATWKWSLRLLSQVSQYHSTIQHQLRNAAAVLQQEEKARAALHGIAASTTAGAVRVTEM